MSLLDDIVSYLEQIFASFAGSKATKGTGSGTDSPSPPTTISPAQSSTGGRCHITEPENIGYHFYDTGSAAWADHPHGWHLGSDFEAPMGSPVMAAYAMRVIAVASYFDPGRKGTYVIGILDQDSQIEYYSGHLQNVSVTYGSKVACGQKIGETNEYGHTHIQIKDYRRHDPVLGQLVDPEKYFAEHP